MSLFIDSLGIISMVSSRIKGLHGIWLVASTLLLIQHGNAKYHSDEIFDWKVHIKVKNNLTKPLAHWKTDQSNIHHCHPSDKQYNFIWDDEVVNSPSQLVQVYPVHQFPNSNSNSGPNNSIFIDSFATNPNRIFQVTVHQLNHAQRPECGNGNKFEDLISSTNTTLLTKFYDCVFDRYDTHPLRMAVLRNAVVNNYGAILNPSDCKLFRNGGCHYMHHGKIYKFLGKMYEHDLVISLGSGASGTWHFPMESIVALAYLPKNLLHRAIFLVPQTSQYITSWLATLGIPSNRITDEPTVLAKVLLVPEMGRCSMGRCDPYLAQIDWFVSKFTSLAWPDNTNTNNDSNNNNNNIEKSISTDVTDATTSINRKPVILIVQRRSKRSVKNFDEMLVLTRKFAETNNMTVDVHDDKNLPSMLEQVRQFTRADIILAPHGAALLFSVFTRPNACIIEFLTPESPYCYMRLAYIRDFSYISQQFQDGNIMRDELVLTSLRKCQVAIS